MKKNITINMFGQLYAIDEDAYELLKNYLDSIRQYFRKEDGGDEIADDIECRISELFSDLKRQGVEAITIGHVSDIIKRIGNPEEMESGDENIAAGIGKQIGRKSRSRAVGALVDVTEIPDLLAADKHAGDDNSG